MHVRSVRHAAASMLAVLAGVAGAATLALAAPAAHAASMSPTVPAAQPSPHVSALCDCSSEPRSPAPSVQAVALGETFTDAPPRPARAALPLVGIALSPAFLVAVGLGASIGLLLFSVRAHRSVLLQ